MEHPDTLPDPPSLVIRAMPPGDLTEDGDGRTLFGRLARANEWAEIDSVREGHFMERFAPGAFRKTFAEGRDRLRILFQHGKDPDLGNKPIAVPTELGEDEIGPFYRGELLEGVPPLIVAGLRAGQYGSSHTFEVIRKVDMRPAEASPHNPNRLPERTITEARVFELGPVTWPAYAGATVGVRSMTDDFTTEPPNPPTAEPEAPSWSDAGAPPHLEPERRDDPDPPPGAAVSEPTQDPPEGGSSDSRSTRMDYRTKEDKAARVTELKAAIVKQAEETLGVRSTDEQVRWDEDNAELGRLERDLAAIAEAEAVAERLRGNTRNVERADEYTPPTIVRRLDEADIYDLSALYRNARSPEDRSQKLLDHAMRAAEQLRVPGERYDQDKSRERLMGLLEYGDAPTPGNPDRELARLVLGTNSPQYRRDFNRYIATGGSERGTALAVGVDGTGGYAVPVAFDPTIVATGAHTAVNPFRAACRTETIVGTDTWQALTANAITAAYATEAAAATEQGPTFTRPEFIAKRAHAFVTVSYEMAQDRPSLPADLGKLFGEARDTLEENQFAVGAGTTVYPQGMGLKDAYTRKDTATNDVHAVADVLAMEADLPIRHRLNAAWFLCRAAIRAIQAYETTGGQLFNGTGYPAVGNPVNRPNGNTGLTLLGYPVWETPSMPWTPTTDDTTWGVLCDPSTYVIVDRVGMSVKVIPDMLNGATPSFPTGEIGIYAFWRNTARVLNADGGRQGGIQ